MPSPNIPRRKAARDAVDPDYVRNCARCGKAFIAGRRDATGCSLECLAALRMRRYRERKKA